MQSRTLIFALLALVVGGGTAYFVNGWIAAQRQPTLTVQPATPPPAGKLVLVASKDLPAGVFISPDSVRWQTWPEGGLAASYTVKGQRAPEDFHGAVVRQGIAAGEPITDVRVVKPNDRGFLAAVLTPGMRAISISVNATSGVSGFVFPGDRVDVILAHRFRVEDSEDNAPRKASETVMRNVRILAIDQKTNDQDGKPLVAKTATVEVTPKQAEELTLAAEMGKLSFSLQSLALQDPSEAEGRPLEPTRANQTHTWDSDVSSLLRQSDGQFVNLIRGSKAETVTLGERQ